METFATYLQNLLIALGDTAEHLAETLKIPVTTIYGWLAGKPVGDKYRKLLRESNVVEYDFSQLTLEEVLAVIKNEGHELHLEVLACDKASKFPGLVRKLDTVVGTCRGKVLERCTGVQRGSISGYRRGIYFPEPDRLYTFLRGADQIFRARDTKTLSKLLDLPIPKTFVYAYKPVLVDKKPHASTPVIVPCSDEFQALSDAHDHSPERYSSRRISERLGLPHDTVRRWFGRNARTAIIAEGKIRSSFPELFDSSASKKNPEPKKELAKPEQKPLPRPMPKQVGETSEQEQAIEELVANQLPILDGVAHTLKAFAKLRPGCLEPHRREIVRNLAVVIRSANLTFEDFRRLLEGDGPISEQDLGRIFKALGGGT